MGLDLRRGRDGVGQPGPASWGAPADGLSPDTSAAGSRRLDFALLPEIYLPASENSIVGLEWKVVTPGLQGGPEVS
jgi:hypothetical protein